VAHAGTPAGIHDRLTGTWHSTYIVSLVGLAAFYWFGIGWLSSPHL